LLARRYLISLEGRLTCVVCSSATGEGGRRVAGGSDVVDARTDVGRVRIEQYKDISGCRAAAPGTGVYGQAGDPSAPGRRGGPAAAFQHRERLPAPAGGSASGQGLIGRQGPSPQVHHRRGPGLCRCPRLAGQDTGAVAPARSCRSTASSPTTATHSPRRWGAWASTTMRFLIDDVREPIQVRFLREAIRAGSLIVADHVRWWRDFSRQICITN
jgi:hypothetical protein